MRTLSFFCLILFVGCSSPSSTADQEMPNIILIFADDLGYGDLGCFGHPNIQTPRLDQMAREGLKLTAFYTAASVCTPSRAGLLTGRYPIRFGMPGNLGPDSKGGIPASELTLAEALKAQGYYTACFGKWHLGSVPGHMPTEHGFDEYYGILYSNDMMPPWVRTDRPLHLYRNLEATEEYPVDQTTLTQRYTDEAIRVIQSPSDAPFFIYLPHAMPHLPVYASEAFSGRSAGGKYGDVIEELDANVGRILDALAESGQSENTLVIFTSDNGPWNEMPSRMFDTEPVEKWDAGTQGPLRGSKASTWDGGLRVPCIMRWPGHIEANRVSAQLLSTLDLYPTLINLAGGELPQTTRDGQDLSGFLFGEAASPREWLYYYKGARLEGIRDQSWKLKLSQVNDSLKQELFHLGRDPYERFDVAIDHPDRVAALQSQLRSFAEETGATLLGESTLVQ